MERPATPVEGVAGRGLVLQGEAVPRVRVDKRWAALAAALLTALVPTVASATPQGVEGETKQVIAGRPEYQRSGYFKWHFGENYRALWTTPFEIRMLDMQTYAGGLTPVRQVGSMQSLGLALKGKDGRSYTFRTFDKEPTRILPPEWRHSFPATLFQDQTTASHPGGAFVVPPLAEAAGIPHADPAVVFMPDDPVLGEFREAFGGKPGTIDLYPQPAGEGQPGFLGATEIISTSELWQRWLAGSGQIDTQALLRARIFDLFIGDWDRHNGQWRWMNLPGHEGLVALPEDRDQAFADFSGAVLGLVRRAVPRLIAWRDDYENMDGLLFQGREIDDWLLTGVERAAFDEAARDIQKRLTDEVIDAAVHGLPPEWFAVGAAELAGDLKKRRDLLPEGAAAFYENLARWVDVHATDQDDVVRLARDADGSAVLELSLAKDGAGSSSPYFRRRFLPGETDEIRLYLYGGKDSFVASGRSDGITVRVAGGAGEDRLDDSHGGGTHFYDVEAGEVAEGPGTGVSSWEWTRVPYKKETPWMEKKDFGSLTLMQPLVWWEPDPGVVLSFGATRYSYGFRKQPYSSMQHAALEFKTARTAFGASYVADFRWSRPGFLTLVELDEEGAKNYNFYGFGNESPEVADDDDEFVEAHQDMFEGFVSLVGFENRRRTFGIALGPQVKYSRDDSPDDSLLGTEQPYGFGNFGQVGARLRVEMDTRGRTLAGLGAAGLTPGATLRDTGLKAEIEGLVYAKAWDVEETFGTAFGALTGYWQPATRLRLAGRAGGQKVWGRFPWYEAAFIGGSDNVRGYDRNRFAGDSSAYFNTQVMVDLFNLALILPMRFGVLGLADTGRVWSEGETSDKWHSAAGGGIYLRVLTSPIVFHGLLAQGDEGLKFYVNIGYGI